MTAEDDHGTRRETVNEGELDPRPRVLIVEQDPEAEVRAMAAAHERTVREIDEILSRVRYRHRENSGHILSVYDLMAEACEEQAGQPAVGRRRLPRCRPPGPIVYAEPMTWGWLRNAIECPACGHTGCEGGYEGDSGRPCPRCEGRTYIVRHHRGRPPQAPRGHRSKASWTIRVEHTDGTLQVLPLRLRRYRAGAFPGDTRKREWRWEFAIGDMAWGKDPLARDFPSRGCALALASKYAAAILCPGARRATACNPRGGWCWVVYEGDAPRGRRR
jgi:hypothetical protein